jgi:hypothetical protein
VPVTGRLSSKFYERLGDDVTNELADWMNAVDLSYKTQMRDMNDLFWERMTAALKSEMATLREDMRSDFRANTASFRAEITGAMSTASADQRSVPSKMATDMMSLRTHVGAMRADLLKWMFIYWCGVTDGN